MTQTPTGSLPAGPENVPTPLHSDDPATRLGAHLLPDGSGTRFRVWAPRASAIGVRVNGADHDLPRVGPETYELTLPVGVGARYLFVLDGQPTPDPYARFLPDGVHGEAEVLDLGTYTWQHPDWCGLPLDECVFYELHIGTFTQEGTYRAAQERLPELKALGVTAIELMPLAAFPGARGWGYDGVALYAPHAPYGRPEDLMAFVDTAHGLGLAVFLDVVYNHFGPDGNYLSCYSETYFTDRFSSAWGAGLDYAEPHMRRLITGNARMWLRDYRFDGLRLDATQAMSDDSDVHVLQELAAEVHALGGTHLMLAEDYRNIPELVTDYHLDGIWVDDFHHEVRVTLTGERDGYYACFTGGAAGVAHVVNRGWAYEGQKWPLEDQFLPQNRRGKPAGPLEAPSFVYFIQNHDQIGNRAQGDRIHHLEQVTPAHFRGASALLLSLPMTPLLFQGQEWAASTPFPFFSEHHGELGQMVTEGRKKEFGHFEGFQGEDVLDPQAEDTFRLAHLNWAERGEGEHVRTLELYRTLLRLRREDPVLRDRSRRGLSAGAVGRLLWVRHTSPQGERVLLWHTARAGEAACALGDLKLPFALPPQLLLHSEGPDHGDAANPVTALHPGEAVILASGTAGA
ncbi:malto-oligosyltrehalose trehalohydrolase [uncultured Deinococcus sp.]|uniref:malto-oligosyltrehalose trehalohydrolase n=1 Tax=uncultured Deinococcus sp. TaxID=158789 RepID=UPI00258CF186|nr:malto-oligosyltrehalose trehalohydrolase [uncultured Deinococcus sp.]